MSICLFCMNFLCGGDVDGDSALLQHPPFLSRLLVHYSLYIIHFYTLNTTIQKYQLFSLFFTIAYHPVPSKGTYR
jgi:hypothetical protein